ncbi:MAG: dihydroorotase [Desulfobacterales bacterium]
MSILINGAKIIDGKSAFNGQVVDILIEKDRIADIFLQKIHKDDQGGIQLSSEKAVPDRVVNASGFLAVPGLIDMHVHFREPGHEYKETIESGSKAAVAGGFAAVCTMPNTRPVNDNAQVTSYIIDQAAKAAMVRVYPVAAISPGLKGEALCEFAELKSAGAIAVSDDGNPVTNARLMRKALEYAKGIGLLVISHCEVPELAGNGVMNEGEIATRMGLAGIPNAAESIMVARDIALSELTQAPVHIAHVSTHESVHVIRDAKKRGVRVTAETAPHYFSLTDEAVCQYDTHAKMNPPLRSGKDREAVCRGLADGTIDVIATDHAPHSVVEKDVEFDRAANGIIGLETSLCLSMELVRKNILSMEQLVEKMATNPARILGIECGITTGKTADITLIDPDYSYVVNADKFQSKSRNTPFNGWNAKGRAVMTIVGGRVVFEFL